MIRTLIVIMNIMLAHCHISVSSQVIIMIIIICIIAIVTIIII